MFRDENVRHNYVANYHNERDGDGMKICHTFERSNIASCTITPIARFYRLSDCHYQMIRKGPGPGPGL